MRSQSGATVVELVAAVGILVMSATVATVSYSAALRSAQIGRAASQLVDTIAIARLNAVSKHHLWRIYFEQEPAGSEVSTRWELQYCSNPACSAWNTQESYATKDGTALKVPTNGSGAFIDLRFNKAGFHAGPTHEIAVCHFHVAADGTHKCQTETIGRTIKIYANTGLVEY